jgi:hypothetical protein
VAGGGRVIDFLIPVGEVVKRLSTRVKLVKCITVYYNLITILETD